MQILNDPRPWWGTLHGRPLSLRELIERGTLSCEAAATLGWAIGRGASAFVAAGPSGAGKSTLATALLEFLPANAHAYVTSGAWDSLDLPPVDGPIYLLINELSWHMPAYLSGLAAQRAFGLLKTGVRMIGTLHARTATEAAQVMCDEADVARSDLAAAFMIAVVSASWSGERVVRQVIELGFLPPVRGEIALVAWASRLERSGIEALAAWTGLPASRISAVIAERAAQLSAGLNSS